MGTPIGETERKETSSEDTQTQENNPDEPSDSENWESTAEVGDTPETETGQMTDEELADVVKKLETDIAVVGCGGGGNNTVTRMKEEGIEGADLIAINTDAQHLLENTQADSKLLIGEQKTKGRGAGAIPRVGEEAALSNQSELRESLSHADMVFVTAGMGGGTGTGAAPVVAETAQRLGALTISIVTTPFTAEGQHRMENAKAGIERLRNVSDTLIVVPNDKLLDSVGKLPLNQAFKIADEVLMRSVKGITELITKPGLVNLDFADVTTTMENGGVAMIGMGESDSQNKSSDALRDALNSPLLDVDIDGSDSVLVNVTGGPKMSIEEAEGVVDKVYDRVDPDARIIWGASIDEELEGMIRVMLVVTGVDSPQMFSQSATTTSGRTAEYIDGETGTREEMQHRETPDRMQQTDPVEDRQQDSMAVESNSTGNQPAPESEGQTTTDTETTADNSDDIEFIE